MSVRYATVTAMRAAATSGFNLNVANTCYVDSVADFFNFVRGSTAPDTADVVSSSDALGKWHRMGIPATLYPGGVLLYDASGSPVSYAAGSTRGQVLTSNGAGAAPTWQAEGSARYLGAPGLRSYVPSSAGGTLLNMMSKSRHQVGDDVAAVQFAIPNWAGTSEAGPGAATTATATVELDTGQRWQLTLAGATSMSISDGGMIWTDPIPWVIPRGTWFNFYCYRTNAVGCPYTANVQDHTLGELIEYNVGVDKTASGTISPTETAPWFGPCGIRGLMTRPSVCIMGDSISVGQDDVSNGAGAMGSFPRVLQTAGIPWTHVGIGNTGANGFLSGSHTHRITLASLCSHLIQQYGTNDLGLGDAQMRADLNSINALLPAAQRKYIATMTPRTTGSWGDLAGQSLIATQGVIDSNNTWRRTVPSGFSGCFDTNAPVQSGTTGKWLFPGYTADGLHPSATGYAAIVSSGVITTSSFVFA